MKWTVSNWFHHTLKNEQNQPLGSILRTGGGYRFINAQHAESLTVSSAGEKRVYRVIRNGKTTAARMTVKPDERLATILPDRADCMEFQMGGETVRLRQSDHRDFTFAGDTTHGSVHGMLGRTAVIDTDDQAGEAAALLYILADIMLHEDDVSVV